MFIEREEACEPCEVNRAGDAPPMPLPGEEAESGKADRVRGILEFPDVSAATSPYPLR